MTNVTVNADLVGYQTTKFEQDDGSAQGGLSAGRLGAERVLIECRSLKIDNALDSRPPAAPSQSRRKWVQMSRYELVPAKP